MGLYIVSYLTLLANSAAMSNFVHMSLHMGKFLEMLLSQRIYAFVMWLDFVDSNLYYQQEHQCVINFTGFFGQPDKENCCSFNLTLL